MTASEETVKTFARTQASSHRMIPLATKVSVEVYDWVIENAIVHAVTPSSFLRGLLEQTCRERAGNCGNPTQKDLGGRGHASKERTAGEQEDDSNE